MFSEPHINIKISGRKNLLAVKKEFNKSFPFLKIEFYSARQITLLPPCRNCRYNSINITGEMKVWEMKKMFKDIFGLTIHVFRKSGNVWLKITSTDDWTLNEQNVQGKALSKSLST